MTIAKVVRLGAALLVILASATWLLGRDAGKLGAGRADRSKLARSEPTLAPARAPKSEANGAAPRPTPPAAAPTPAVRQDEFIDRLFTPPRIDAGDAERLAWEESGLSGYIYPVDHPCEGLPTDIASVDVILQRIIDNPSSPLNMLPEVDRPQVLLEGRKGFFPLNNLCGSINREDPTSVEAFIICFTSHPEVPRAPNATIWLPVPADHPGATTMREHFTRLIRKRAEQLMAGPRCKG